MQNVVFYLHVFLVPDYHFKTFHWKGTDCHWLWEDCRAEEAVAVIDCREICVWMTAESSAVKNSQKSAERE